MHRANSPREPLEIFSELVAENPPALTRLVSFDFPRDRGQVHDLLESAALRPVRLWHDAIVFRCDSTSAVLEHLLKSAAVLGQSVLLNSSEAAQRGENRRFGARAGVPAAF